MTLATSEDHPPALENTYVNAEKSGTKMNDSGSSLLTVAGRMARTSIHRTGTAKNIEEMTRRRERMIRRIALMTQFGFRLARAK